VTSSTLTSAAALGACCLPALGHAEPAVAIYGPVDTTVQYTTGAGPAGSHSYSMGDGAFTGSRLGFRGTEDLGDGMKAFFSIEQGLDPSSGQLTQTTVAANYGQSQAPAGRAFGREVLVGLTVGDAGTVTLGRQYTLANAYSRRFQPWANPTQEALALLVGHQLVCQDNMVKYTLDIGAFNVGASKTLGEGSNGSSWGVGAAHQQGPFDVTACASAMDSFDHAETRRIEGVGGAFDLLEANRRVCCARCQSGCRGPPPSGQRRAGSPRKARNVAINSAGRSSRTQCPAPGMIFSVTSSATFRITVAIVAP